jgi:SMC interacting uncharacterized protein involved in chromosome segregation
MKIDLLDAALSNAERLYASVSAFRKLCGDISDFQDEAKRAKADAAAAQKSLSELQSKVTIAQAELDKLQSERDEAEKQTTALRAEHTDLMNAMTAIRNLLKDAA